MTGSLIRSHLLFIVLLLSAQLSVPIPSTIAQNSAPPSAMIWQRTWGGSSNEQGTGLALDRSSDIYVTGETTTFGLGGSDIFLLKYNSSGGLLLQRTWGGTQNEVGTGVAADYSGNVFVTGYTNSFGAGGNDTVILRFNSTGSLVWQRTWGGVADDHANGITTDSAGGIYIVGETSSTGAGGSDAFLLKLNQTGSLIWERTWGGNKTDYANGLVVDHFGNIYITGFTRSFGVPGSDVFLLKLNSSGNLLWQRIWEASGADSFGNSVGVDAYGTVYVAGSTLDTGTSSVLLLKFDSTGSLEGQSTWGSGYVGRSLAANSTTGVLVTGTSSRSQTAVLLRFDSSGNLLRQRSWGIASSGNGITTDADGNAIITGTVGTPPPYTVKPLNETLRTTIGGLSILTGNTTLGIPTFGISQPAGIAVHPSGSQSYAGGYEVFLLKYNVIPATIHITFQGQAMEFNHTYYYVNGQNADYPPGIYAACVYPYATVWANEGCYGYSLSSSAGNSVIINWTSSGGITVADAHKSPTNVTVAGDGSLNVYGFVNGLSLPASLVIAAGPLIAVLAKSTRRKGKSRSLAPFG